MKITKIFILCASCILLVSACSNTTGMLYPNRLSSEQASYHWKECRSRATTHGGCFDTQPTSRTTCETDKRGRSSCTTSHSESTRVCTLTYSRADAISCMQEKGWKPYPDSDVPPECKEKVPCYRFEHDA